MTATDPEQDGSPALDAAFPMTRWAWLRVRIRKELESRPDAVAVTLPTTGLSTDECEVLRWLLRLADIPPTRLRIPLARLDRALADRTDVGLGTQDLLAALDGDLDNMPEQRRTAVHARTEVWTSAAAHPAVQREPRLESWLRAERDRGSLPADPQQRLTLLREALDVLDHRPGVAGIALTQLAAQSLGRAHALDPGAVAGLVLRAIAHLHNVPQPATWEQARACWALAGVRTDNLSSRVLTHGFHPTGQQPLPTLLRLCAQDETPVVLTLQQVDRHSRDGGDPLASPNTVVSICENVTVISEAAHQLGAACAPLICVEGRPSLAALRLMNHLRSTGATLRYHGDFDWDGLAIADQIMLLGATPWRMNLSDYQDSVEINPDTAALPDAEVPNHDYAWAPGLVSAMRQIGRQIEEEQIIDLLLGDLQG